MTLQNIYKHSILSECRFHCITESGQFLPSQSCCCASFCHDGYLQVLALLFSIDDISGFEVTNLIELPEPWGALVLWGVVLPACFVLSQQLTNFVLREGLILKVCKQTIESDSFSLYRNLFKLKCWFVVRI